MTSAAQNEGAVGAAASKASSTTQSNVVAFAQTWGPKRSITGPAIVKLSRPLKRLPMPTESVMEKMDRSSERWTSRRINAGMCVCADAMRT
eukprot:605248-Prymnesium_polylepis.1